MFTAYRRTFDFKGRASRSEYWTFIAVFAVQGVLAIFVDVLFFEGSRLAEDNAFTPAIWSVMCANLLTSLAVQVRRLHDIDRSGWWFLATLLPFVGVFIYLAYNLAPGNPGRNRFGRPPGERAEVDVQAMFS